MTMLELSYHVFSKSFTLLLLSVVLIARSSEENVPAAEAVASAAGNNTRDMVADPGFNGDLIVNAKDLAYLNAMRFKPLAPVAVVNLSLSPFEHRAMTVSDLELGPQNLEGNPC